jgi:hypothetical protein
MNTDMNMGMNPSNRAHFPLEFPQSATTIVTSYLRPPKNQPQLHHLIAVEAAALPTSSATSATP